MSEASASPKAPTFGGCSKCIGHLCAATYIDISALAAPVLLVQIEAEAVNE